MAIYNGTQKVAPSGISKVYVGSQLVYQAAQPEWHTVFEGTWIPGSTAAIGISGSWQLRETQALSNFNSNSKKFRVTLRPYGASGKWTSNNYNYYDGSSSASYAGSINNNTVTLLVEATIKDNAYSATTDLRNTAWSTPMPNGLYLIDSWCGDTESKLGITVNGDGTLCVYSTKLANNGKYTSLYITKVEQYY